MNQLFSKLVYRIPSILNDHSGIVPQQGVKKQKNIRTDEKYLHCVNGIDYILIGM